jgi:hypothetical protein
MMMTNLSRVKQAALAIAIALIGPALIIAASADAYASVLTDGSFESPSLAPGAYQYGGNCPTPPCSSTSIAGFGWTFTAINTQNFAGGSGIINATASNAWWPSPTFSTPTGFDGNQYAFVQGSASLSQTFTAPSTGTFVATWLEGSRPNLVAYDGNQSYEVLLNSSVIGTYSTLSGQNFELESSLDFNLIAGDSYTLTFLGLTTSGDHTVFLDAVSIDSLATPLPAALPIFGVGLVTMGLLARRRRRRSN